MSREKMISIDGKGNFPANPQPGDWCTNMKGTWEWDGADWKRIKIHHESSTWVERVE